MNNIKKYQYTIRNAENPPYEGYNYSISQQGFSENGKELFNEKISWARTFIGAVESCRSLVSDIHDTIVIDWRNIKFDESLAPDGRLEFKIN